MASPFNHVVHKRQIDGAPRRRTLVRAFIAVVSIMLLSGEGNAADQVRISGLSNVAFGTITNFASDAVNSQSVCLYAKSPPNDNYSIIANGSGSGGAFLLSSGSAKLAYEVQWADTANQTVGTKLIANQALTGQHSSAGPGASDDCSKGPATTASLIVVLRSAALNSATSGTYSGTLTLLVAPE